MVGRNTLDCKNVSNKSASQRNNIARFYICTLWKLKRLFVSTSTNPLLLGSVLPSFIKDFYGKSVSRKIGFSHSCQGLIHGKLATALPLVLFPSRVLTACWFAWFGPFSSWLKSVHLLDYKYGALMAVCACYGDWVCSIFE